MTTPPYSLLRGPSLDGSGLYGYKDPNRKRWVMAYHLDDHLRRPGPVLAAYLKDHLGQGFLPKAHGVRLTPSRQDEISRGRTRLRFRPTRGPEPDSGEGPTDGDRTRPGRFTGVTVAPGPGPRPHPLGPDSRHRKTTPRYLCPLVRHPSVATSDAPLTARKTKTEQGGVPWTKGPLLLSSPLQLLSCKVFPIKDYPTFYDYGSYY